MDILSIVRCAMYYT